MIMRRDVHGSLVMLMDSTIGGFLEPMSNTPYITLSIIIYSQPQLKARSRPYKDSWLIHKSARPNSGAIRQLRMPAWQSCTVHHSVYDPSALLRHL